MIRITGLTKRYGEFTAVQDVSFEVHAGETFAVLGPNGSGKTTILKCIAGLHLPTAGDVRVGGIDIGREPTKAKALFSYLPQRVTFNENLTARELAGFYARLRRLPPARVEQVLRQPGLGLNGFEDKPIREYSGGMVQRLGIALALLPDPPLLILDEPAVSLDPEGTIRFREVLQHLKCAGKTILFSSHGLFDVELLADRVAVLVGGRLVALEPVARFQGELTAGVKLRVVLSNPAQKYAAAAVSAGASEADLAGNTLTVSCTPEARLPVLRALEQAGGTVERFSTDDATLEEMYLNYVATNGSDLGGDSPGGVRPGAAPPR